MGEDYIDQLLSSQQDTLDDVVETNRFWDPSNYDATIKDGVVLQPRYTQPVSAETGETTGPVTGVLRYKEGQTQPGQIYDILDPVTGEVTGKGRFKEVDSAWDLIKQAAADLGPILSFTPLAPLVRAVGALSAAEQGDILGALASGLPIADKIPGLDKAAVSTLKDIGKYASVGKAAQSGDWRQVLNAASQIPGIDANIPKELKTLSSYASQADAFQRAAKGDLSALIGLAKSSGALPTSKLADVTGEDAIEGFFAPGGEGYDTTQEDIDSILARYKDTPSTSFTPGSDDVYEDIESLLARYENQGFADQPTGATDQTLEITGRRDDLSIDPWLQPFVDTERRVNVTEGEPQTIEVTGKREGTIIPDWDILPDAITTPRSIRDIGTVTKVSPDEKLEGTEIKEPDLVTGLTPAKVDTTKTDTTTTTKTDTKPATPGSGMDLSALFALLGAMGGQGQDRQTPAQVNVARGTPESPYGLMYDLRG